MTNSRSTLPALILPVAVAALTAFGLLGPVDSSDAGPAPSAAEIATKCVGVDYRPVVFSRCVPFPGASG